MKRTVTDWVIGIVFFIAACHSCRHLIKLAQWKHSYCEGLGIIETRVTAQLLFLSAAITVCPSTWSDIDSLTSCQVGGGLALQNGWIPTLWYIWLGGVGSVEWVASAKQWRGDKRRSGGDVVQKITTSAGCTQLAWWGCSHTTLCLGICLPQCALLPLFPSPEEETAVPSPLEAPGCEVMVSTAEESSGEMSGN